MQGERIVLDGLWRCLCPSVDTATLSRALQRPVIFRHRHPAIQRRSASTETQSIRSSESNQLPPHRSWSPLTENENTKSPTVSRKGGSRWTTVSTSSSKALEYDHLRYIRRKWKRRPGLPFSFFSGQGCLDEDLDGIDTDTIIEGLRELIVLERQYVGICNTVRYLVTRRNKKPDVFLYECLIKANTDPEHGSAKIVANILQEMESQDILPTPAIFHSVLDVLAVHPDYVLRNRTIENMKGIWNPPTFDGQVTITIGLLRDGQYEMALEKLEELHKTGVPIPTWLYDIFIFTLGEIGVHEETLMVMQHRLRQPDAPIAHNIWHFLLDVFSRDAFYEGIKYIWNRVVVLGKVVPSDGVALNCLNTASRNGDVNMAMQVIKHLSTRGVRLGMHHFEPLLEIQANDHDLRKALSTTCLMAKAGLHPDRSSTRPIWMLLQNSPEQVQEALAILHDLKKNHQVPVAAFNAVLEATLWHRDFKAGLDLYRSIHQVCSGGPDIDTYTLLLQKCTLQRSMNFILAEMEQFSIEPDEAIYDRIIFISTLNSNYEPAFRHLEKMLSSKTDGQSNDWWISRRTALSLLRRSILAEDVRAQSLISECKKRDIIGDTDIKVLLQAAQQRRQAREEQVASESKKAIEPGIVNHVAAGQTSDIAAEST